MKLNFGCGYHKVNGYLGVDKIKNNNVDIVHDMNVFPYPFQDNSVDEILLLNILEHLRDTVRVVEELWRISKNETYIKISVPYYNSLGANSDPTHIKKFTEHTFDYFTPDNTYNLSEFNYYSIARFRIINIIPCQRKIFSIMPKKVQWFMAHHFCTVHNLVYELSVIKND